MDKTTLIQKVFEKLSFNKEQPTELVSQLVKVIRKGLGSKGEVFVSKIRNISIDLYDIWQPLKEKYPKVKVNKESPADLISKLVTLVEALVKELDDERDKSRGENIIGQLKSLSKDIFKVWKL